MASEHYFDLNIETPNSIHIVSKLWSDIGMWRRDFVRFGLIGIDEFRRFIRTRMRSLKNETNFLYLTLKFVFFFETIARYLRYYQVGNISVGLFGDINEVLSRDPNETTEALAQRLVEYVKNKFLDANSIVTGANALFGHTALSDGELIEKQAEFLSALKIGGDLQALEKYVDGSRTRTQENFVLSYGGDTVKKFVRDLSQTMTYFETVSVGWLGISSGQRAYLNLFASLYNEIRNFKPGKMVLCIDEGDLYLHPKWQIEFFSKLIKVLPSIYQGEIQLILTSHSPFLLSDLPRQNIEILSTDVDLLSAKGTDTPTFGGNLYDLYSGPLFLGRDRTGIFSRDKIAEFLKVVDKEKLSRADFIYIDRFLAILGDEILKFKVEKKRNEYDKYSRT